MNTSSAHWISLWKDAAKQSLFRKIFTDESICWNASAKYYDQTMGSSTMRVSAVMDLLSAKGLLNHEYNVLDIGSGTGSYTLPLSRFCRHVTAMDISDSMNRILHQKMQSQGQNNFDILQEDFCSYDFGSQTFDIVLASLAPGLYHPDALLKMISICSLFCIYIGIDPKPAPAGQPAVDSLNDLLLGHSLSHSGSNHITYPLNLLRSIGYKPELTNVLCTWNHKEPINDAILRLTEYYMAVPGASETWYPIIESYITEHSDHGYYYDTSSVQLGILSFNCQ